MSYISSFVLTSHLKLRTFFLTVCATLFISPFICTDVHCVENETNVEKVLKAQLIRKMRATDPEIYPVTGGDTVPPGLYSGLTVVNPLNSTTEPDIIIGSGEVILKGTTQELFSVSNNTRGPTGRPKDKLLVQPDKAEAATLRLVEGSATGNIQLTSAKPAGSGQYYPANLLIGPGNNGITTGEDTKTLPDVTINGRIDGMPLTDLETLPGCDVGVETQGANLIVNGGIGNNVGTYLMGYVNASNGTITVNNSGRNVNAGYSIMSNRINVNPGLQIKANNGIYLNYLNLGESSSLIANAGNISENRGWITISNKIGDESTGTAMKSNSLIQSSAYVFLVEGVAKGSGSIIADRSIIAHLNGAIHDVETKMASVVQGENNSLFLESGTDILAADLSAHSVDAKRDILSGTYTFAPDQPGSSTEITLPGRYFINARGDGYYYPRNTVTGDIINAGGRLLAGEVNVPETGAATPGTLTAGNAWISRTSVNGEFTVPSGNLNIASGSFKFTNASNLTMLLGQENNAYTEVSKNYASLVDGNLTVRKNGDSTFTTLKVGMEGNEEEYGLLDITGGTLKGQIKTGDNNYTMAGTGLYVNTAKLQSVTALQSDVVEVAQNMTASDNGNALVNITKVTGDSTVTSGTYTGNSFHANKATFDAMDGIYFNSNDSDNITTKDDLYITLLNTGHADINVGKAGKDFSLTGGEYKGVSLTSGGNAEILKSLGLIVENGAITGTLNSSDSGISAFNTDLTVGQSSTFTNAYLQAWKMETGNANDVNGHVTITNGSIALGISQTKEASEAAEASVIHGALSVTGNGNSSFKDLVVDSTVSISGGSIVGEKMTVSNKNSAQGQAPAAQFNQLSSLNISNELIVDNGDLNIADNQSASIKTATVKTGDAIVSKSSYSGTDLTAKNVSLSNMEKAQLTGTLAADNIAINLAEKGSGNVATSNAASSISISGGAFTGASLTAGTDANIENVTALNIDTASVGKNLTITDNGTSNFKDLTVDGVTHVTGGSFNADEIITGAKSGNGDVTITNGIFNIGSNSDNASAIHGNFSAFGNTNSVFGQMTVDKSFSVNGGYVQGGNLTASGGKIGDGAIIHIDNLVLTGAGVTLDIEDGSVVTVKTLKDQEGNNLVGKGGLYVLDNANVEEVYLQDGDFIATSAIVNAQFVEGFGANGETRNVKALSLVSDDINIANVNLQLNGIGDFSSKINEDLNITKNGDTRLADTSVGGNVSIEGGSVNGRKLTVDKNATFDSVTLNLQGTGANASSVTGDLVLKNNESASLGDIKVSGNLLAEGGALNAGVLTADNPEKNVTLTDVAVNLQGNEKNEGNIAGSLNLINNRQASLGYLNVAKDLTGDSGELEAAKLTVGGTVHLDKVSVNLPGIDKNASSIGADLLLDNNENASFGDVTVSDNIKVEGGKFTAGRLNTNDPSGEASFNNVELTLKGTENARASFAGNLILVDNKLADLGYVDIGKNLSASGGNLNAESLHASGDVLLTGVQLKLNGKASSPDTIIGSLRLAENKTAQLAYLNTGKDIEVQGGSFAAQHLDIGGNATFQGVDLTLNGTEGSPDSVSGDFTLKDSSNAKLGHINIEGLSAVADGQLDAHHLTSGSLEFNNVASTIDRLDVKTDARFSGGKLTAREAQLSTAELSNGLEAELKSVVLGGETKILHIGNSDSNADTLARIEKLDLNAGRLNIGNNDNVSARLFVNNFSTASNANANINGHIEIGWNGQLITGTLDSGWLATGIEQARATFALAQPMRLGSGYGIHVTGAGQPSAIAGQIRFDAGSLFVIDASNPRIYYTGEYIKSALLKNDSGATGALSAETGTSATVSPDAQIYIRNPQANTVIVALGENINTTYADTSSRTRSASEGGWTGSNLTYDNADKVKIERLEGEYAGQFSVKPISTTSDNPPSTPDNPTQPVEPVSPETPDESGNKPVKPTETHPSASSGIHDAINNGANQGHIGTDPNHLGHNNGTGFISHTIANDKPHEATKYTEGALRIPISGGVPQLTLAADGAAEEAMLQRVDLSRMLLREEDIYARHFALWAMPLYKTTAAWDMEAGNLDYNYHGAIGGLALGGDITFEDVSRFGIAVNFGGAYSKSGGELTETTNNMSFWGVGAYGGWRAGNFGVNADARFTSTYNKLRQDVSGLSGWQDLKADALANVFGAAVNLEYRFNANILDIIPHAGINYHYLHVWDYDVTHKGHTIIEGDGFDQNIWTFPIGVKLAGVHAFENGWHLKPSLDFRFTPAAGDIKARTRSRFTNTSNEIELDTKIMDYCSWGGTVGLEASMGDFALGINYSVEAGAQSFSNAIFGTLRYEF